MKTIFLSMPMRGRKMEDILYTRDKMKAVIEAMYPNENIAFVDNTGCEVDGAPELVEHMSLLYLGEAIKKMAYCDTIAVIENRYLYDEDFSGCNVEDIIASSYELSKIKLLEVNVLNENNVFNKAIYCPDLCEKVLEERKRRRLEFGEDENGIKCKGQALSKEPALNCR